MERIALVVADGNSMLKKVRFSKLTGAARVLDEKVIDRGRMLAGLKGYVKNLPFDSVPEVKAISAYRDLRQVEVSVKMTKSDLRAILIFHREMDSIVAHLTVVYTALAIGWHLHELTGLPLNWLITDLKAVRSAKARLNGQVVTFGLPRFLSAWRKFFPVFVVVTKSLGTAQV